MPPTAHPATKKSNRCHKCTECEGYFMNYQLYFVEGASERYAYCGPCLRSGAFRRKALKGKIKVGNFLIVRKLPSTQITHAQV